LNNYYSSQEVCFLGKHLRRYSSLIYRDILVLLCLRHNRAMIYCGEKLLDKRTPVRYNITNKWQLRKLLCRLDLVA
jgi:hypothetical protein